MDKKYYPYIDVIRIISMLFIIILHSASYGLRAYYYSKTWWVLNIITSLGTCAVPLFFMISGALLLSSDKTDNVEYMLKKRMPHLVIPLTFWSLAYIGETFYYIHKNLHVFNPSDLWEAIVKLISAPTAVHLWFMYALIPLYIVAPFIRKIIADKSLVKYLLCLWILGCAIKTMYYAVPEQLKMYFDFSLFTKISYIDGFLGYFVLGWYLHKYHFKLKGLLPMIALFIAVIAVGTCYATYRNGSYSEIFKSYTSIWVITLSALLYITAQKISAIPQALKGIINYLSSLSMGIYMSGNLFLNIMRQEGMTFDTARGFVLCTLYTLTLCIVFNSVFKHIKPLCYIATGNKYGK
jgi:surface polysaccharide O-acyltransferase-like enzyme